MTQPRLVPFADNLWFALHDVFLPGRICFETKMVVLRLTGGGLVIFSPIPIDDSLQAELEALGPVGHLVAPNGFHHLFFADAAARFPDARTHGSGALAKKRPDLEFDETLTDRAPESWAADIDQAIVAGCPSIEEVVFLHRASSTLLVTDLVFNIHSYRNWITSFVLWLAGARGKVGQSRLWRLTTKNKAAAGESLNRILAWEFDRVLMSHGKAINSGARAELTRVLGWALAESSSGPDPALGPHRPQE